MFWHIVTWIATTLISYALQPKPAKPTSPAAATIDDIQAPTAEVGRELPVLFGTRDIKHPNVVWYGHLRTVEVRR